MDITITAPTTKPPTRYANSLSMTIKSFKGRRDVEVHLFRGNWDEAAEAREDWQAIIENSDAAPQDSSKSVILESFTDDERDHIVDYLKRQYSTRLSAIRSTPLSFPVPAGLCGLSHCQADKNIGFIEFDKIPSYPLDIPLKGLYDLSQHPPIVEDE